MVRILLLLLITATASARASDPISATYAGASSPVSQPHVTAELIPETNLVSAGKPFDVILHLDSDPGWHTYWINPGDAGLATTISWTLPPGFTAGPIQWPTPEKHAMGPLMTYGYAGDVYLLTTITPPKTGLPRQFEIKAHAEWLVCKEECIPGRGDFSLKLNGWDPHEAGNMEVVTNTEFFQAARERLPVENTRWDVRGFYGVLSGISVDRNDGLRLYFESKAGVEASAVGHIYFFPEQNNVLDPKENRAKPDPDQKVSRMELEFTLAQNGEKPPKLSGVLVSDKPLIGNSKAIYISEFPVRTLKGVAVPGGGSAAPSQATGTNPLVAAAVPSGGSVSQANGKATAPPLGTAAATTEGNADDGSFGSAQDKRRPPLQAEAAPPLGTAAATTEGNADDGSFGSAQDKRRPPLQAEAAPPLGTAAATAEGNADDGSFGSAQDKRRPPLQAEAAPPLGTAAATPAQPFFLGVLGAAFLGGLILNLMPCVLPVLSLKVFSLVRHAGDDPRGAWKQGVAFTAGVVVSFWILAGLLLALRAFGKDLGWGFQMQSPGFVLALIFLFFLLALNLFGLFEFGTSLVGVDARAAGGLGGGASSFANGALATVAATPCTGPYLGWALGLAVQESTFASFLIFTCIALGLAAPYLLLTAFPGALRFVPKPGAWMESLRQVMGFLLLATVIWLVYIFGALVGGERVPFLLGSLLLATVAAWIYGRWVSYAKPLRQRIVPLILTLVFLGAALKFGIYLAMAAPAPEETVPQNGTAATGESWQPWTPAAVEAALAQGRPVFVDFTAAWCGNCKVNEWYALENGAVLKAFAGKKVALFRADWTRYDPGITKTLLKYNRSGVPLYLLYSPQKKDAPQVLPDGLITPGTVLDALKGV